MVLDCNNLSDKCGIMGFNFIVVQLSAWNGRNIPIQEDTKMIRFVLNFSYKHKSGGRNGCDFCTCYFNFENEKWSLGF